MRRARRRRALYNDPVRVLVVEDETKMRAVLRQGLRENGFAVDVAETGDQGLMLAQAHDYDAILLDVMLPGLGGFEVLQALRKRGSKAPIIMLTARSSVEDRVRGLDLGADDYLAKPFDFQELLARIRAVTRRPSTEPRSVLRCADLELDPARHVVRRAGQTVELTAKEFALLHYLMRQKNLVVTPGMILDRVWDMEYDGGSNLVAVYINYVRRKVDHDFEPRLIHTVRGVGYVLREPE
jgi:heavy metal response regulator